MGKPDPLSVQVSIKTRLPKGFRVTKKVLNEAYLQWVETGELPPSMEIKGIFWKNSARRSPLDFWRYSSRSDLETVIPNYKQMTPEEKRRARIKFQVESSPRGDHEEARMTLQGALRQFRPF